MSSSRVEEGYAGDNLDFDWLVDPVGGSNVDISETDITTINLRFSMLAMCEDVVSKLPESVRKINSPEELNLREILYKHQKYLYNKIIRGNGVGNEVTGAEKADLSDLDLSGLDLSYLNLEDVNLKGAKLRGTNLEGVNLEGSNLEGADFMGANLKGANLFEVDIQSIAYTVRKGNDAREYYSSDSSCYIYPLPSRDYLQYLPIDLSGAILVDSEHGRGLASFTASFKSG
ncbi:pentapeptide repeat-containing protein [Rickettsiales bacterium]|nr:pentapeptide repeat-containing protein [Rickettsiales bacterium]